MIHNQMFQISKFQSFWILHKHKRTHTRESIKRDQKGQITIDDDNFQVLHIHTQKKGQ